MRLRSLIVVVVLVFSLSTFYLLFKIADSSLRHGTSKDSATPIEGEGKKSHQVTTAKLDLWGSIRNHNMMDVPETKIASVRVMGRELLFDNNDETFQPWKGINNCKHFVIRFLQKNSLKPIAVASRPGAGNTWTRFLVESATGIFTSSIYDDITLKRKGLLGETRNFQDGSTILQKTHLGSIEGTVFGIFFYRDPSESKEDRRAVVIIRDPFEAIVSEHNFWNKGHQGLAVLKLFQGQSWQESITHKIQDWLWFALVWLESVPNAHLLFYEELKDNVVQEIREVLEYLQFESSEKEERLACLQKQNEGSFKRTEHFDTKSLYNNEQKHQVSVFIEALRIYLKARNWRDLPVVSYDLHDATDVTYEEASQLLQQHMTKMQLQL